MSTRRPFNSTVKLSSTHLTAPSLIATVSAPLSSSRSTLLSSSKLELRLQVRVTGAVDDEGNVQDQEMSPEVLLRSALLNEVKAWLEKHKSSLNIDGVGDTSLAEDQSAVIVPLHSYTRSAMCTRLSMPRKVPPTAGGQFTAAVNQSAGLSSLDLIFVFSSPPADSSQPSSFSINDSQALLDTLGSPSVLHFTLSPLVARALAKIASKLVAAFPLCFNARWIERLSEDLASHSAIASSLTKILDGLTQGSDLDTKAALLKLLNYDSSRLGNTTFSSGNGNADSSSTNDLSSALLILAQNAPKTDAWKPLTQSGSRSALGSGPAVTGSRASKVAAIAEDGDEENEGLVDFAASDEDGEGEESQDDDLLFDDEEALGSDVDFEELSDSAMEDLGMADCAAGDDAVVEEADWIFGEDEEQIGDSVSRSEEEVDADGKADGEAMELELANE